MAVGDAVFEKWRKFAGGRRRGAGAIFAIKGGVTGGGGLSPGGQSIAGNLHSDGYFCRSGLFIRQYANSSGVGPEGGRLACCLPKGRQSGDAGAGRKGKCRKDALTN